MPNHPSLSWSSGWPSPSWRVVALCSALLSVATLAAAQQPSASAWTHYQDMAQSLLQRYVRVNTTNPPGHELRAARFWQRTFQREGIPGQIIPFAPGRADFIAVLHSDSKHRPIVLLNHEDVVTSVPSRWMAPPFSGAIVHGQLFGRGSEDMKDEGVAQAMAMFILHRQHIALHRDVIFLAVGDEEVDDLGAQYIIQHKRALLRNARYLITEGGENIRASRNGPVQYVGIDIAEKAPYWLHLVAGGHPGHGARPVPNSAPNRLVRALNRVVNWRTPLHVTPEVEQFFRALAPMQPPARRQQFLHLRQALKDPAFADWISQQTMFSYMLRDTISLTMMQGSQQTNVIPAQAWANLDVRLLPGTAPSQFLAEIEKVIDDPGIQVTEVGTFRPPNQSPTTTDLYRDMVAVSHKYFPGTPVTPRLLSGFTESEMFRRIGIDSYGFCPYAVTEPEADSEHADNERMDVRELRAGQPVMYDLIRRIATQP